MVRRPSGSRGSLRAVHHLPGPLGGDQTEIIELYEYDHGFGGCCGTNFLTKATDGRGNETLHTYDPFGNREHTQHRISSIVQHFTYNEFGQMTAHTRPDNGSSHRGRDEFTYYDSGHQFGYRKEQIIDAPGFALTTTLEYDHVGNLTRTIDPEGHDRQYLYNQLDQVVRSISAHVTPGGRVRYERDTYYDANDNVVRLNIHTKDDAGVLQANTHFTTIHEYEILNHRIRTCEELGDFTGTIPGTIDLPECAGLPEASFITTEYEHDEAVGSIIAYYMIIIEVGFAAYNASTRILGKRAACIICAAAPRLVTAVRGLRTRGSESKVVCKWVRR